MDGACPGGWSRCKLENHLDLRSIERLERALVAYPGAVLLVTHDRTLARACTRTTWKIGGGRVEVAA